MLNLVVTNLTTNMQNNNFLSREKTQALIDGLGVKQSEGKAFLDGLAAKGYTIEGFNDKPTTPIPSQPTFKDRLTEITKTQSEKVQESARLVKEGKQGVLPAIGQTLASGVKAAGESFALPVTMAAEKALQFVGEYAPENIKQAATELVQKGIELSKPSLDAYAALPAEQRANIQALTDLVGGGLDLALGAGAIKPIGTGVVKTAEGAMVAGEKIRQTASTIANAPIVSGTGEVLKSAGRTLKSIPENIATNVGEMQAKESLIKSIPSVTGQKAARSGVDVTDITTLKEVVNTPEANTLYNAVKDFAAGTSKVDPIEVVGRPITQKIKILNTQLSTLGKKLGAEANKLGTLDNEAVQKAVLKRLQGVSGLKGLKVADDGALDFTETTLKSSFTEADRKAIETAYKESVNSGSGKQAHLYRQELFEVLDGKKRSLANITDTQDKALNAIRAGLSDVLEVNNPVYKTLSNEYRQTIQPLSELRKLSKTLDPNNPQDILDLSAGLLARRLTSAGASNPQVRMVLAGLDKATKVPGKTLGDTQKMQDLYNVLNKYFDIAPKTGFQNLVKEGVSSPSGVIDQATEMIRGFTGNTNAVRQKAIDDYIQDLFSTKTSKPKK